MADSKAGMEKLQDESEAPSGARKWGSADEARSCLLYTSDAADEHRDV